MPQVEIGCLECGWDKTVPQDEAKGNEWKDEYCDDDCNETLFYSVL